jgi:hypothetical protein
LPQHSERDGQRSRLPRRSQHKRRLVWDGQVLTDKATRRLRGDRQPVHRIRSAATQLDRRPRCRASRTSCRCLVRQQALHRSDARLSSCSHRATGHVPQTRRPGSPIEGGAAFRRSGRGNGRAEPQPIPLRLVRGCAVGQGFGARAAGRERADHEGRGVVERGSLKTWTAPRLDATGIELAVLRDRQSPSVGG